MRRAGKEHLGGRAPDRIIYFCFALRDSMYIVCLGGLTGADINGTSWMR
jgi:hypothetical protein